jgi:AbrB family looped-hinge helix DNA binding protein
MMIEVKVGTRGEIVIPKKIREAMGILPQGELELEVEDNRITLQPKKEDEEFFAELERNAKYDTSKWVMGNDLYEEEFR